MTLVIASSRPWAHSMPAALQKKTGRPFTLLTEKSELTPEHLKSIGAEVVFFPHWSHIIPESVFGAFECVIFHMTDLPFGRGGSPLQNLVARGFQETKISALRCSAQLDGGPIYLKAPLSLLGTAEEVFLRASEVIIAMIETIVTKRPTPQDQVGEPTVFPRRKPEDSRLPAGRDLSSLFRHVQMLDAEGYPAAFLEAEGYRFEFSRAALKSGHLVCDVKITSREDQ